MIGEEEEALFWAGKAIDVHHDILETVRSAAAKWQAGIATFLARTPQLVLLWGQRRSRPCLSLE